MPRSGTSSSTSRAAFPGPRSGVVVDEWTKARPVCSRLQTLERLTGVAGAQVDLDHRSRATTLFAALEPCHLDQAVDALERGQ